MKKKTTRTALRRYAPAAPAAPAAARRTTRRRRKLSGLGAMTKDIMPNAMDILLITGGKLLADKLSEQINLDAKIKGAILLGGGVILPSFVKQKMIKPIAYGIGAAGAEMLLKEFGVLSGLGIESNDKVIVFPIDTGAPISEDINVVNDDILNDDILNDDISVVNDDFQTY